MINTDRIVPITKTDLLTIYGNILTIAGTTVTAAKATDPGVFEIESASGALLAAEPVETLDFASGVTSATVYFVAAYNYAGFTIAGAAATTKGDTVSPDGCTLYTATLADGAITIAKIGF